MLRQSHEPRLRLAVALLSAALLGCAAGEEEESGGAMPADGSAEAPGPPTIPDEIYHDLTEFDWYRRGAPLLHDGAPYQPAGRPVPAETSTLEPAGSHEGVRYWTRTGAARADTLFVPVYPRYWLPFTRASGGGS